MATRAWDDAPLGMSEEVLSLWAMVEKRFRAQEVRLEDALRRIAALEAASVAKIQDKEFEPPSRSPGSSTSPAHASDLAAEVEHVAQASSGPASARRSPPTKPPALPTLHIYVTSRTGRELARMTANALWTRQDVCARIRGLPGPVLPAARIYHGGAEILDKTSLGEVGVEDGACLQLLLDERKGLRVLSLSQAMIKLWSAESGECLCTVRDIGFLAYQAIFSPDGELVLFRCSDGTARIWSVGFREDVRTLMGGPGHAISSVEFSPDGSLIAAACADGTAKLLSPKSGECVTALTGHEAGLDSARFSPDGKLVVTASVDGTAKLWKAASGECLHTMDLDAEPVWEARFSPDGALVVTGCADGMAKLWGADSVECHQTLQGHGGGVFYAAFSPGGDLLLTASEDATARLWQAESGECLHIWEDVNANPEIPLAALAFSPGGALVVTASGNTVSLWESATGLGVRTLAGHDDYVTSVVFSPDGAWLVTASDDATAKLWSVESGECFRTLEGHGDFVCSAIFSPPVCHLGRGLL